jgi:hypothetical protein
MAIEIKYEKINSNNMRKWIKDLELTNKQDLQGLRNDYQFIVNMSDTILEKLNIDSPANVKTEAQIKVDAIDDLLDLFNNSITSEEIEFINED